MAGAEGLISFNQRLLQQKGRVGELVLSHPSTIARSATPAYADQMVRKLMFISIG